MTTNTGKPFARFEDPFALFGKMLTKLYSVWVSTTFPFSSVGRDLSIHYACQLSRRISPRIVLGNSVIFRKNVWINILEEAQGATNLSIGDRTCINAQCTISAKNSIQIESDVMISSCVLITDHNHSYEDTSSAIGDQGTTPGGTIRIEKGCWIGYGAAIVCNQGELVVGANSVVAANALVTKSFPAYSVIVGNPGRLARQFEPQKGAWARAAVASNSV